MTNPAKTAMQILSEIMVRTQGIEAACSYNNYVCSQISNILLLVERYGQAIQENTQPTVSNEQSKELH